MAQQVVSDMINGVSRVKWWKYRYVLLVLLVLNLLLINHFIFDRSIADLSPFPAGADVDEKQTSHQSPSEPAKPKTPAEPATPATPAKPAEPEKPEIPASPSPPAPVKPTPTPDLYLAPPPKSPGTFNLNTYDFNGQYIGWPLARVCKEAKPTVGLVYICDNNSGGIGNIRNFILTCIRYAIEAGASGIVMPRIQRRSEDNLGNLFSASFQPLEYFFDVDHFRTSFGKHCSHIRLYDKPEDIPNFKNLQTAHEFYPKDLIHHGPPGDGCDDRGVNRHIDQFREDFDNFLHKTYRYPNETVPLTVRFRWATFFEWDIYRDGPEFANTFGDLLRIRHDIQELAAITLDEIKIFVNTPIEPYQSKSEAGSGNATEAGLESKVAESVGKEEAVKKPEGVAKSNGAPGHPEMESEESIKAHTEKKPEVERRKVLDAPYLGIHLRTEGDALGFWPDYQTQSTGYIKAAKKHGLKHAYIATGNATEGHRFRDQALKELGMAVAGKTDLLKGENLKRLNELSWDQQALVDFLILSKSAHFTGCSFSSFTMNIAFKRHTMTDGIYSRPWKSPGDAYSTLVGRFENWWGDWMFMYECMWP